MSGGRRGGYNKVKWCALGSFNDGKDAHHILLQQTLKKLGLNVDKAPAIVMPKNLHELTISYRGYSKGMSFKSLRDEVEANIQDVVKILKDGGKYSLHTEKQMREAMTEYMNLHKNIFK